MNGDHIEQVWNRDWPWPTWLTVLVSLLVAAGVVLLYLTERGGASLGRRSAMVGLRVAAILLVAWMLAGWCIERYQTDLPELVLLIDDSASMQTSDGVSGASSGKDIRSTRWETVAKLMRSAWSGSGSQLLDRYRLKLYWVSEKTAAVAIPGDPGGGVEPLIESLVKRVPDGQQSRLGDGLNLVLQRQAGRPTAAVVLLSDGIVTDGAPLTEAIALARRANIPIYAVACGDQLPQPDLALLDLRADEAVYLGDRVNVQVSVSASDLDEPRATIHLREMQSGQIVDSVQVDFDAQQSSASAQLSYVPKSPGNSLVQLEVVAAPGEKNLENNRLQRVIEVRDQTLKVLLVQRTPSFEYRFLKTLLERTSNQADRDNRAFQVDAVLQDADASHVSQDANALRLVPGDAETIAGYDVIIIGAIDPTLVANSTQQLIVDQVANSGTGVIFICDPEFEASQLVGWPLQKLLPIDAPSDAVRTQPRIWQYAGEPRRWQPTTLGQSALPLQLAEVGSADDLWHNLPGPEWYYRPPALKPGAQILATAESASAADSPSSSPLLLSQFVGAGRVVLQTNDETYRWQGFRGSELTYERYWIQMLRWLARGKLNRESQTELVVQPRRAQLGETIQFLVRLSPELAASLQGKDCEVALQRIGSQSRSLTLARAGGAAAEFRATENQLPAGSYRATLARPTGSSLGGVTFTVTAPPGEQANLRSDWRGLHTLAEQTQGRFAPAKEAEAMLRQLPQGTPLRRGALPPIPIWNSSWIALALVTILTLEWLLRRTANML